MSCPDRARRAQFASVRASLIPRAAPAGDVQVRLIPELRAERLILIHVHVIESLRGHVALILDDRIVWPAQIGEAGASCRLHALGLRLGDAAPRSGRARRLIPDMCRC